MIVLTSGATVAIMLSDKVKNIVEMTSPWQENYSKSKSQLGALYGFPYVFNYLLLNDWGQPLEKGIISKKPRDTLNNFYHVRKLTDAEYRDGGAPNNDAVYSLAYLYVDKEPVIVTAPVLGNDDRYWALQFTSFTSDNYAYISKRATGNGGGNFAIVPSGWKGTLPEGVTYLAEAPTKWSLLVGQTVVRSQADLPNVHKIQDQYQLTALSDWGKAEHVRPSFVPVENAFPEYAAMFADPDLGLKAILEDFIKYNPENYLAMMNYSMTLNGIPEAEQGYMEQFREVGIGSDIDLSELRQDFIKGRLKGAALGLLDVVKSTETNYGSKSVDGWTVLDPIYGHAGMEGKYLVRSALQSLTGIVANDIEEASYSLLNDDVTRTGVQKPSGEYRYVLHFTSDQMPKVGAFWSLSAYDDTNNLIANKINRYSIGDRTKGLVYNDDGGVSLYISYDEPSDKAERSNWLPTSKGEFYMVFRAYLPGQEIIEQTWTPPKLTLQ